LWIDLPRRVRAGIALAILAYSASLLADRVFFTLGWAVGITLLLFALPRSMKQTTSEQRKRV
jgi:hypothetical protein